MTQLVMMIVVGVVALAATIIAVFWALNLSTSVYSTAAAVARVEAAQAAASDPGEEDPAASPAALAESETPAAASPIDIEPFVD
jgi:flagellar basal body-associated protein FliL